jgi:hypothetical protein
MAVPIRKRPLRQGSGQARARARKNPDSWDRRRDRARAVRLYEDFSGHEAEELGMFDLGPVPKVAVVIGELEAVIYNTVRDGVSERYIHKFKARARPMFATTPDGKQLLLLGGDYDFTERGIVDG